MKHYATEVSRERNEEILNELIGIKEYMQSRDAFHGYGQINDLIAKLQSNQEGKCNHGLLDKNHRCKKCGEKITGVERTF